MPLTPKCYIIYCPQSTQQNTIMLRTYFQETFYDMDVEIARKYAEAIKAALVLGQSFEGEKKQGYFISKNRGFEDKLYVGNIHRIQDRLEWNGEELEFDDLPF